jgi:hypothetical protein
MQPLTCQEKQMLQDSSWRKWCLDRIDRQFYNVDPNTDKNYAVFASDAYPYATVLYNKMFFIKCILNEGYLT